MSKEKHPILPPYSGINIPVPDLSAEALVQLLEEMIRIREFEEKVQRLYMNGLIHGTTHLCQGHEAISVGAAMGLKSDDYVTVTYRSHGHAIAKGMEMKSIFAELMGRAGGCSKGKGGSMHLTDFSRQLIGSFGIVGAGLPVALGAAMTSKLNGDNRVSVTFFGDGATNIGTFHETLNMASVWKAPVIFICENNIYGEFSRIDETTCVERISERAGAYRMPAFTIDGNNVLEVMETVRKAAETARNGAGPVFIECLTYRHRGHSRTDPAKYRPEDEVKAWLDYDPIRLYSEWLEEKGILYKEQLGTLYGRIRSEVDRAADDAENMPWPKIEEATTDVYA